MSLERLALVSVTDPSSIVDVARCFQRHHVHIISSGDCLEFLRGQNVVANDVMLYNSEYGQRDHRLANVSSKIADGLFFPRNDAEEAERAVRHGVNMIDFVIGDLGGFQKVVEQPYDGLDEEKVLNEISLDGSLRMAAANYKHVTALCDPQDYPEFIRQMDENDGKTLPNFRKERAAKVFEMTSGHDAEVGQYFRHQLSLHDANQPELPQMADSH